MVERSPFADGRVIAVLVSLSVIATVASIIAAIVIVCWCRLKREWQCERDARQGLEGRFANAQFDQLIRYHSSTDASRSKEALSGSPRKIKITYDKDDFNPKPAKKASSLPPSSSCDVFKASGKESSNRSQHIQHPDEPKKLMSEFVRLDDILTTSEDAGTIKKKQSISAAPPAPPPAVNAEEVANGTETEQRKATSSAGGDAPAAAPTEGAPGN